MTMPSAGKDGGQQNSCSLLVGMQNDIATMENSRQHRHLSNWVKKFIFIQKPVHDYLKQFY